MSKIGTWLVLHWSQNWMDGLHIEYCKSESGARAYIEQCKPYNNRDTYIMAMVCENGFAVNDIGKYIFVPETETTRVLYGKK